MNSKNIAYEIIKDKIISAEFLPGEKLSENKLMTMLNIGRTPIREALSKLENENLVEISPKRGIFITEISVADVRNNYGIREVLEPYAIELASPSLTSSQLAPYFEYYQRSKDCLDSAADDSWDQSFHFMIYEASGNQLLCDILKDLYHKNLRTRKLSTIRITHRRRNTCEEHYHIIEALMEYNTAKAKKLMKKHISTGCKVAMMITVDGTTR